jgi:hypothetical protein
MSELGVQGVAIGDSAMNEAPDVILEAMGIGHCHPPCRRRMNLLAT